MWPVPGVGTPAARSPRPISAPRRQARQRDPVRGTGLAAEAIAGNLVFARDQVTAWYVLPPQRWSFRSAAERTALAEAMTTRISKLAGRRIYFRVTTRPFAA